MWLVLLIWHVTQFKFEWSHVASGYCTAHLGFGYSWALSPEQSHRSKGVVEAEWWILWIRLRNQEQSGSEPHRWEWEDSERPWANKTREKVYLCNVSRQTGPRQPQGVSGVPGCCGQYMAMAPSMVEQSRHDSGTWQICRCLVAGKKQQHRRRDAYHLDLPSRAHISSLELPQSPGRSHESTEIKPPSFSEGKGDLTQTLGSDTGK